MKRRLISVLLGVILLGTSFAEAGPVLGQVVLVSPVWPCNGVIRYLPNWTAPTAISIRRVEVWIGSSGSLPDQPFPAVDLGTALYINHPRGFLLASLGFDHYVPFTGLHQLDKLFPPDQAPSLPQGGHVSLGHVCQAVFGIPSLSQTSATITYLVE